MSRPITSLFHRLSLRDIGFTRLFATALHECICFKLDEAEWCDALTPPLTRPPSLVTTREGKYLYSAAPFSRQREKRPSP